MDSALLDMAEHNSEAYAVGERNGIAVAPDDVTYHNNARYYAQIASSQIVGDASSAVRWDTDQSEALTDAQKAQARENINAASDSDVVKITSQTLTSAEQAQARANIAAGGSNENLVDNSWFTVRQRGDGPFGIGYGVDRWTAVGGAPTITPRNPYGVTLSWSNAIALDQYLSVNSQWLAGKTVTLSVMVDSTVYSASGVYNTTGSYIINISVGNTLFRFGYFTSKQCPFIRVGNVASGVETTINVDAVKLELGSVSTLANDAPPDYGTELIKCRGYFERIHSLGSSEIVGMGMGVSASSVRIGIPSLICHTIQSVTYSGGGLLLEGGGNYRTLTSIGKLNATPKNGFLTVTCGSSDAITLYQTYALVGTAAGGYIDISADL
jgi:hypothetical protein